MFTCSHFSVVIEQTKGVDRNEKCILVRKHLMSIFQNL